MIARQGNSWIVVLRKTPDRDAAVREFLSRKAAIMFIGDSDLKESGRRTERKRKEWNAANKDHLKELARARYRRNKEKLKAKRRNWYAKNKEKIKEYRLRSILKKKLGIKP